MKPSTIALSKDNSEISGISDLDEVSLSPKLTDDAIAKTKKRKENGESINDLSLVPDYYNVKISPPPVLILDSIDADSCEDKGILKIKGKIEGADITEEMKIDLPLAYPTSSVKCDIDIPNENGDIEANCAVQTAFKNVEIIVIEQNILKKKNKELLVIKGAQIPLAEKINCKNGNEVKMDLAQERQASGISFLQLSKLKPSKQGFFEFFFGALKKPEVKALRSINLQVSIWVNEARRLRRLQSNKSPQDTNVNCVLENSFGDASGYGCSNTKKVKGTIEDNARMKVDEDSISNIAGIHGKLDTDKVNNKIDYSDPNNLKKIGELYHVKITEINGNNCPDKGQLIIFGETTSNENLNENYKDVEITFGYPESGGLCSVYIQD